MKTKKQLETWTEAEVEALLAPVKEAVETAFSSDAEPSDRVLAAIRSAAAEEAAGRRHTFHLRLMRRVVSVAAAFIAVLGVGIFALQPGEQPGQTHPVSLETLLLLSQEDALAAVAGDDDVISLSDRLISYQGLDEPLLVF